MQQGRLRSEELEGILAQIKGIDVLPDNFFWIRANERKERTNEECQIDKVRIQFYNRFRLQLPVCGVVPFRF